MSSDKANQGIFKTPRRSLSCIDLSVWDRTILIKKKEILKIEKEKEKPNTEEETTSEKIDKQFGRAIKKLSKD